MNFVKVYDSKIVCKCIEISCFSSPDIVSTSNVYCNHFISIFKTYEVEKSFPSFKWFREKTKNIKRKRKIFCDFILMVEYATCCFFHRPFSTLIYFLCVAINETLPSVESLLQEKGKKKKNKISFLFTLDVTDAHSNLYLCDTVRFFSFSSILHSVWCLAFLRHISNHIKKKQSSPSHYKRRKRNIRNIICDMGNCEKEKNRRKYEKKKDRFGFLVTYGFVDMMKICTGEMCYTQCVVWFSFLSFFLLLGALYSRLGS